MARKILLADDSVTAQNMGRKILADAGYEVITVNNGSAALKKIIECKPAVAVLDVYMPGYSGLEVCARIKEGHDTAGIPVLLTVGKLEPFRQEEARKVRADAFIIKPFEASELLAALGKLEKTTYQSEPPKAAESPKGASQFAATMDRYERMVADQQPRFGDQESGWKSRLTVPSHDAKREEPEPEPEIAGAANPPFREFDRDTRDRPSFSVIPGPAVDSANSGLPGDVTQDELAAIAAAAAAIGGAQFERDFERLTPQSSEGQDSSSHDAEPATFAGESSPAHRDVAPSVASSSPGPVAAQVDAVFTSFASAGSANPTAPTAGASLADTEPATVAMIAGSDSASMAVGARWVAEEVPVEPAESALVLEREMHKAFAAFAAAERSGSYEPGPVDKSDEPMFASIAAPPPIGAPSPVFEPVQSTAEPRRESEPVSAGPAEPVYSAATQKPLSSPVSKPPAMPFREIAPGDEPKHAVVAFGEPHPFGAPESGQATAAPAEPELPAAPVVAENCPPVTAAAPPEDWHELRPSVTAKSAPGSNGGGSTFEDFKAGTKTEKTAELDTTVEPAAMAAAASGDSSSSSASSADTTLSSIVDNMLAELKPKLMAELAKKLDKK